jgi:hypothetical protein
LRLSCAAALPQVLGRARAERLLPLAAARAAASAWARGHGACATAATARTRTPQLKRALTRPFACRPAPDDILSALECADDLLAGLADLPAEDEVPAEAVETAHVEQPRSELVRAVGRCRRSTNRGLLPCCAC